MPPGNVRPASLPVRLEPRVKPRSALWRAAAARREAARYEQRRRDRSLSCRTNQLNGAELVIKIQRRHLDGDVGNSGRCSSSKASAERIEIRQSSGIEFGIDSPSELGFAGTILSERQQSDDRAARLLLAVTGQQCFEGALIGAAREELLTIDQIEQGHWLAAQGMDDVPIIDHMTVFAAGRRSPAAQRDQRRRAQETFEPIVIQPHAKAMADQARGHRIEHLLEGEPAGRTEGYGRLFVIRRPPRRQCLQGRPFEIQPLAVASIAAPDELVDKAAISLERIKIARSAQQQRVLDRSLQMAVRAFDRAVLMRQAPIVAGRLHAVMRAQCLVAPRLILSCVGVEIAEGGRETVASVVQWGSAA